MTGEAIAVVGWLTGAVALTALVLARRSLAARLEAVAEACHELRGPLTAATLSLELCQRHGELSQAQLRGVQLELARAGLALGDLEAARRVGTRPGGELVPVRELLVDCTEAWRPRSTLRGVDLGLHWSGPDALVVGDRLRLAQAVGNLVSNAIEHGRGKVEVSGRAAPWGVRVEVADRGEGLSAPIAELIRRSGSDTRWGSRGRRGPRGLRRHGHGLRVARAVAVAHGGRLAAAPSERGARLVLELPTYRLNTSQPALTAR
jgi:signal transduction histidine kinase